MSEWLDLMVDEVARKQREAKEAKKEQERRDEAKPDTEADAQKRADQSK